MEEKTIRRIALVYAWYFALFGILSAPIVVPLVGDGIGDMFAMENGFWSEGGYAAAFLVVAVCIWAAIAIEMGKPNAKALVLTSSGVILIFLCSTFAMLTVRDTFRGSMLLKVNSLLALLLTITAFGVYFFIRYSLPPKPSPKAIAVSPWLGRVIAVYLVLATIACLLFIVLPSDEKGWAVHPSNFGREPSQYVGVLLIFMTGVPAVLFSMFILLPLLFLPVAYGLWMKRAWGYWSLVALCALSLLQSFLFLTIHVMGGYNVINETIIPTLIVSIVLLPLLLFTPLKHMLFSPQPSNTPSVTEKKV